MKLRWLGHACFEITTQSGVKLIIDPYDDSVGYGRLKASADAVIASHAHHDHNYLEAVSGYSLVIDREGVFNCGNAKIETMTSFHDDAGGKKRGTNLLTKITADGQSVVHLGDLGHEPNKAQLEFISGADALLIPIGGYYTIDTETALGIAVAAKPKAVIPMHYKTAGNDFPISTADEFAKKTHAKQLEDEIIDISKLNGAVLPKLSK